MGSYQPQPLGLRRPKAQPRFFLQQGEQRILQGPQLLLEEGLPSSLHNCGPSAQTPFILVLDPTVSPPLPPFLFLHISFTFAVSLNTLLSRSRLSEAYFTLLSPVQNFVLSGLIRALVASRLQRHPRSPTVAHAGVPRGSHTTQAPVHSKTGGSLTRSHQKNAQGGSRALPIAHPFPRNLTHCQDSDHLRSRRAPVGTTGSRLHSQARRAARAREAAGALGPAPGPSPPRPARCPRAAGAAAVVVVGAPVPDPRPRGRRRRPPLPRGRHRPGLRAQRPWPRLPAGSR